MSKRLTPEELEQVWKDLWYIVEAHHLMEMNKAIGKLKGHIDNLEDDISDMLRSAYL